MRQSKYSNRSSSDVSQASTQQSSINKLKSPLPSDYEYLGRLVTRERPIVRESKAENQNRVFSQNKQQYHHTAPSNRQDIYEAVSGSSSDDDDDGIDNSDGLSKPIGVIRINDRHLREIYRLPTPPPKVRRVYHRLRSPETKVIERVFVRRPPPQIIENIIEVPPEKVRIINREKYLGKPKPITRSKLVHLKARQHHQEDIEEQHEPVQQQHTSVPSEQYVQQQQQQQPYIPSDQYPQQQHTTGIPHTTYQPGTYQIPTTTTTTTAALVYPPQPNAHTLGYIQSTVPPHIMFSSQQPLQIPAPRPTQPVSYTYAAPQQQQLVSHQAIPQTHPLQQTTPVLPYGFTRF